MTVSIIRIGRHAFAVSSADARAFMELMERAVQVRAEVDTDFAKRDELKTHLYYHRLAISEMDDIEHNIHPGEIEDGPRVALPRPPIVWSEVKPEPVNMTDLVWGGVDGPVQ